VRVVLILLGREKIKGEGQEESVCVVLILLGRENSKRECVCCSENPFRKLQAFQSGSTRTRSDADATKHKNGSGRHTDASDDADQ